MINHLHFVFNIIVHHSQDMKNKKRNKLINLLMNHSLRYTKFKSNLFEFYDTSHETTFRSILQNANDFLIENMVRIPGHVKYSRVWNSSTGGNSSTGAGAWLDISIHGCHYIIQGSPKNGSYLQDLKIPRVPGTRCTRSNQAPGF